MNSILAQARNETLTKRYKRKVTPDYEKKEQTWVNEDIRRKIKERKESNRRKRNERNKDKQKKLETKYIQKKKEVQKLVKESITTYEKMLTEEIKRDKNKLWVNIDKLRNKSGMKSKAVQLYSEEGVLLGTEDSKKELVNYWKTVYSRHENLIEKEWNTEKERCYVPALAPQADVLLY